MRTKIGRCVARVLPQGSTKRHLSVLASGAVLGQVAVIAASPILTRLYSPEDFGLLATYTAILGIISTIAGLRYELAIPLPRTNGSAVNILALSLLCVTVVSLLLAFIVILFGEQIPSWLNTAAIAPYLWLLPLGVLLSGIYQSFNYWAIRRKSFSRIARTSIQQGIAGAATQVAIGLAHLGPIGLITGQIIGQSAGLSALVIGAYREDKGLLKRLNNQRIRQSARRYSRFAKYTTWQALANSASTLLPLILFAALLSPSVAGLYMLAHRTLSMPLTLIGKAVGQVFHSQAAEAQRNGTLDILTFKSFQKMLRLVMGPMVFIGILAPDLFALAFGESWRQAGIYAQWMVPWMIVQFVFSPISILISVLELQAGGMISQFGFLIFRVGAILGGAQFGSDNAIIAYALSGLISYFIFGVWITLKAGIRGSKIAGVFVKEICELLIAGLASILVIALSLKIWEELT